MKIKTIERLVLDILEVNSRAREDDFILFGSVIKRLGYDLKNTNLHQFLATAKSNKIPSFETVSRCRRHIQELRQDLKGVVAEKRQEKQQDYEEYNLSGLGENER